MPRCLLSTLLFIVFTSSLYAQPINNTGGKQAHPYEYYIRIAGINSRQQVDDLQQLISKKPGIHFFMANRYPVRYFMMRSEKEITAAAFTQWLRQSSGTLEFFGEGIKAKEEATLLYNKLKSH